MNLTIPELIMGAAALMLLGFLVHKYLPASAVAKGEAALIAEAAKIAPTMASNVRQAESAIQADAMHALSTVETWLTDTSSEAASIAKAQASIATKQQLLRQHISTLSASLPATPSAPV